MHPAWDAASVGLLTRAFLAYRQTSVKIHTSIRVAQAVRREGTDANAKHSHVERTRLGSEAMNRVRIPVKTLTLAIKKKAKRHPSTPSG